MLGCCCPQSTMFEEFLSSIAPVKVLLDGEYNLGEEGDNDALNEEDPDDVDSSPAVFDVVLVFRDDVLDVVVDDDAEEEDVDDDVDDRKLFAIPLGAVTAEALAITGDVR